ncbi:MAG: hypothetical protein HYY12_07145 [Candidatus Methylomirabilis oxyfera]|nr:hypothetical protein [Candidatus Methylomirabilis oxyfera]
MVRQLNGLAKVDVLLTPAHARFITRAIGTTQRPVDYAVDTFRYVFAHLLVCTLLPDLVVFLH